MRANKSFDLSSTTMLGLIVLGTLEAFVSEAFLVSTVWPAALTEPVALHAANRSSIAMVWQACNGYGR